VTICILPIAGGGSGPTAQIKTGTLTAKGYTQNGYIFNATSSTGNIYANGADQATAYKAPMSIPKYPDGESDVTALYQAAYERVGGTITVAFMSTNSTLYAARATAWGGNDVTTLAYRSVIISGKSATFVGSLTDANLTTSFLNIDGVTYYIYFAYFSSVAASDDPFNGGTDPQTNGVIVDVRFNF
tara:strand:+ start:1161 stop:1718 length:558 start_codon:yes stop_codon:yes gene_type:complete